MAAENANTPLLSIDFHLDVICPWCWIGTRQLRTAIQALRRGQPDLTLQLAWHAAPLQPQIPDQGVDFQAFYLARLGSPHAVKARRAQVNAAAKSVGLHVDFDAIDTFPNSRLACGLINIAQRSLSAERMFDLVESTFADYFQHGRNIGLPEVLVALAQAAGVPWDPVRMPTEPSADRPAAAGVPHFEFNQQSALTGAVPATELLQVMALAAASAVRQTR